MRVSIIPSGDADTHYSIGHLSRTKESEQHVPQMLQIQFSQTNHSLNIQEKSVPLVLIQKHLIHSGIHYKMKI